MFQSKLLLGLLLMIISIKNSFSISTYFCEEPLLRELPIQAAGRTKPLIVHAYEVNKFIFETSSLEKLDATTVFCLLSLQAFGIPLELKPLIKVEHVWVKELLGMKKEEKGISPLVIEEKLLDLRMEMAKRKVNDSEKKELTKVLSRYQTYQEISTGVSWTVPKNFIAEKNEYEWSPLISELGESKIVELKQKYNLSADDKSAPFLKYFSEWKNEYDQKAGTKYRIEYWYFKMHPFRYALVLSLIALFSIFIFKTSRVGILFTAASVGLQITGFVLRIIISGRAPITNMYETVIFSGFGCLIVALILWRVRKENFFWIAGLCYNILTLMMANFANEMLNPSIGPLVPVLRDNFWLSTHVTTVILSYASLALSWILANMAIMKSFRKTLDKREEQRLTNLIYAAMKVGVVMLSGGVILGGVWADYSWGRFWGWDPKETWSLIVLLVYIAILHGKYTNWINPTRFIPLVALAFLSVMMAWFGVNYILAAGLHSYGFSEGGAIFLLSFFIIQISILVFHTWKAKISN